MRVVLGSRRREPARLPGWRDTGTSTRAGAGGSSTACAGRSSGYGQTAGMRSFPAIHRSSWHVQTASDSCLIGVALASVLIGCEKPNPEAFERACERCGWPRETSTLSDDPVADIAGAEAAGVPALPLCSEPQPRFGSAPSPAALSAVLARAA